MRFVYVGRGVSVVFLIALVWTDAARAGGPILFNEENGSLFPWPDNRAVYFIETGDLSDNIRNDRASAVVVQAFDAWKNVSGVNLRAENLTNTDLIPSALKRDFTADDFEVASCEIPQLGDPPGGLLRMRIECELIQACIALNGVNCPSPIIFDQVGDIFGIGSGILGFAGPLLFDVDSQGSPFTIQALVALNGPELDSTQSCRDQVKDPDGTLLLQASATHEIGHFLGLDHSVVNGDTAFFNPTIGRAGTSGPTITPDLLGPPDGLAAVLSVDTETMFPISLLDVDSCAVQASLEEDDKTTLARLYPNPVALSQTGTISGSVFIPCTPEEETVPGLCIPASGSSAGQPTVKRAQGVLVIARRLDTDAEPFSNDLDGDRIPDALSLKQAFSQLTGDTFAPRRCVGDITGDSNGDGIPDFSLSGIFGACNTLDDPTTPDNEGEADCKIQIDGKFFTDLLGTSASFSGQCGFFSTGLSDPRPVGAPDENSFTLTGLPQGQYLVQVTQVLNSGSYSPPLRSALLSDSSLFILSDDNQNVTLFPNPQTGEFYNGSPNGCGSPTAACEQESANSVSDNPFAYTIINVSAEQTVSNVNIFLNTASTVTTLLENPGFNLCQLGDVNGDTQIDQDDIFTVARARADFEGGSGSLTESQRRADLNDDNQITALDVDLITDLVFHPDSFDPSSTEPKAIARTLAPFSSICAAAQSGGCTVLPPDNQTRADGTGTLPLCTDLDIAQCPLVPGTCQPFRPVGCTAINVSATPVSGDLAETDAESVFLAGRFADCYTFSGSAGQQIFMQTQGGFDTFLGLVGPDGRIVASNDDCPGDGLNSCIPSNTLSGQVLTLPSTGTYTVEVSSFDQAALGSYRLRVAQPAFPVGCTALSVPTTLNGSLADGDQESILRLGRFADCYTFAGTQEQEVALQLQSSDFDTFATLIGPDGQRIDLNDDCFGDEPNSCIPRTTRLGDTVTLPLPGTYTIEVTSFSQGETGNYSLAVSHGPLTVTPPTACTSLSLPATQNGALTTDDRESPFLAGRFADCYTFTGSAGQTVALRLQSSDFDTFAILIDQDGQVVSFNDDCTGDGSNSCIPIDALSGGTVALPSNGMYTLEVTSFFRGATGDYSLTVGP